MVKEAARTMGIEILDERQIRHSSHRQLAKAFIVRVRYNAEETPELEESPDEFREMLRDFAKCDLFAEPTYETTRSKSRFKIEISPEDDKKAPYRPPYRLSPKEDAELQHQLD
jgi:hypothetical protein